MIIGCFESIDIWLFPAPLANTAGLSSKIKFEQLQPSFQSSLHDFRRKLSQQLQGPTLVFNREVMTARHLARLVPVLVKVIF